MIGIGVLFTPGDLQGNEAHFKHLSNWTYFLCCDTWLRKEGPHSGGEFSLKALAMQA